MERCINTDCLNFGDRWCAWCYYYIPEEVPDPTLITQTIVNVTYKVNARSTPAFKDLQEQIDKIRLTKYFEGKPKREPREVPF